jgi:hypothetical protein
LLKKLLPLLFLTVILTWLPNLAHAQGTDDSPFVVDWQELKTENFIIVYAESVTIEGESIECPACGVEAAQYYAAFIDDIYADLSPIFEVELPTPLNLRLFPTEESYFQVNPLARNSGGIIAHTPNSREEIAIALPRTEGLTDKELVNNVRHEMTHLFGSFLSDGKLNTGFQEGIAQYLEAPGSITEHKQALLRQAFEQDRILTWAQLDDAQQFYSDSRVAYPQALSIVSFLIDNHGLSSFLEFIKTTAEEPGYRSALEATYGKPADELETEWLNYLPKYFDGRWRINTIYAYDLSRVTELVNKGAYTDAQAELTEIVALLETTDQADTLSRAESLLARAHQGQTANVLADETRQALQAGNYPLTIQKGQAAIAAYQKLEYQARIPEIQLYIHQAETGQRALNKLNHAEELLDSLHFFEAEREIFAATVLLQALDNQTAAQQGVELLRQSARRKSMVAYALLAVGTAILLFNGLRRLFNRLTANPLEVEFT